MHGWTCPVGLLAAAGLIAGAQLAEAPLAPLTVAGALALLLRRRHGWPPRLVAILVPCLAAGALRAPAPEAPGPNGRDDAILAGTISRWLPGDGLTRIEVTAPVVDGHAFGRTARATVWLREERPPATAPTIAMRGTWTPDPGPTNPGMWATADHVGTLSVAKGGRLLTGPGGRARDRLWNTRVAGRIEARLPGFPGRLAAAMLLGRSDRLTQRDRHILRQTGTSHLVAVSGLHVGMIALLAAVLLSWLPTRLRWVCILGAAWAYTVLAGAPASAVRAATMLSYFGLARSVYRPQPAHRVLSFVLPVLIWSDPSLVADVGFWLSVSAVAGILLVAGLVACPRPLQPVLASLGAQWGTLPVALGAFGTVSPCALVPNLVAVPVSGLFLPAALGVALLPEPLAPVGAAEALAAGISLVLGWTARFLPYVTHLPPPWPPLAWMPLALFGFWVGFPLGRRRSLRLRAALLVACVGVAGASVLPRPPAPGPWVAFLDVGQADATLFRLRNGEIWLCDAGDDRGSMSARRTLVPALRALHVRELDGLILSHRHRDHIGGVAALLEQVRVDRVFDTGQGQSSGTSAWADRVFQAYGLTLCLVAAGDTLLSDRGTSVVAIGPPPPSPDTGPITEPNRASLVVRVDDGPLTLLLAGDAEHDAEAACLETGYDLRARFLQVGHHGSDTSSGPAFAHAVSPEWAVVSCGRQNRYGHPGSEALETLRRTGARIHRTDRSGALILRWVGERWVPRNYPPRPTRDGL